ncbi:MAG TPA: amidohydrolase [Candidatus Acidoferrales bacterium]|jgi:5-methylthioadenosine/S-adenosylhomocysteine deaminase|nr:amidohydrolase [Candidatus Acidoferrales bacterium]
MGTSVDLLVAGGPLLTMDSAGSFFSDGAVAISHGSIVAVGHREAVAAAVAADEMIDARGKAILPGFVNSHSHAGMVLLRGLAETYPLQRWLTGCVWPVMKFAGPEETYAGVRLACLEMIRAGITTFTDMWRDLPATAQAVEESGLRARLAFNMRDFPDPALLDSEWECGFAALSTFHPTPLISYGLSPHSLYACSTDLLQRCAETVTDLRCHLQIHLAETEIEVNECQSAYGCTPVERLDEIGLLGPRSLLAHGIWFSETDCIRAAKAGAVVAHNITSNLKLASGLLPLLRFQSAGLTVALGTDSAASNNVLDIFREMKHAALLQRAFHHDATLWPALSVLEAATRNGASALGLADQIGSLETGKRADLILINLDRPHLAIGRPRNAEELAGKVVFSATAADVDTTIVEGRVLMLHREVISLETKSVCEKARIASRRLLDRAQL